MNAALPDAPQSIDTVLDWHEGVTQFLERHRVAVLASLAASSGTEARFRSMFPAEVDDYFDAQRRNLDLLTVLDLVASAEAALRIDYRARVQRKRRDTLSVAYRAYHKSLPAAKKARPNFDEDGILDVLKASSVIKAHLISDFRDTLRQRHWIAHGRHWSQSLGKAVYLPDDVYEIIDALLVALPA